MHNILIEIIKKKKKDLEIEKRRFSVIPNKQQVEGSFSTKQQGGVSFFDSLSVSRNDKGISLIAEIKFASPTNPSLGSPEDLLKRAKIYQEAGANAIAIITEKHFFKGDVAFVKQVKKRVGIPVLQKDFVIDAYQIYQAKQVGADGLLLIARLLDAKTLQQFVKLCLSLKIEPVVEINNEEDLEKAIATTANIIAVNARNLETFAIAVNAACTLLRKIPDKFIKLGFSGIHSSDEVLQYKNAGATGVLVGTSLMKAGNIRSFLTSLRANNQRVRVKICGIRNLANAKAAVTAGADFLGFNFAPTSKRYIIPIAAKKIIEVIKDDVQVVGVFQNEILEKVNEIGEMLDLDFVQLHGEESEKYMSKIKRKIIKKFVIPSLDSLSVARNDTIAYLLLDRAAQGKGSMVDFKKAKKITQHFPTFLAGGLTPENVANVVKKVQPFAVDVAGGIETNGVIDNEKMKAFISNAKEAME